MGRWFATLLLVLLPFQFSWAAVATYCMHERAPAQSQHVGHHEHNHEASNLPGKADDGLQASDTFDVDCCLCHGLGIGVGVVEDGRHQSNGSLQAFNER